MADESLIREFSMGRPLSNGRSVSQEDMESHHKHQQMTMPFGGCYVQPSWPQQTVYFGIEGGGYATQPVQVLYGGFLPQVVPFVTPSSPSPPISRRSIFPYGFSTSSGTPCVVQGDIGVGSSTGASRGPRLGSTTVDVRGLYNVEGSPGGGGRDVFPTVAITDDDTMPFHPSSRYSSSNAWSGRLKSSDSTGTGPRNVGAV
jgi:hypothetical protein